MLQLLIQWLPTQVGTASLLIAVAGALVGAVLWLAGARFSRLLVGLVTVSIGASAGMALPGLLGWSISGAGPAVGLALVMGFSGWAMHRFWIGIGLGTVLAGWALLAAFVLVQTSHPLTWPVVDVNTTIAIYAAALWHAFPPELARIVPIACGSALVGGLLVTLFWPRFAIATAWSAAGASLLVGIGCALMQFRRPDLLRAIPQQVSSQAMAMFTLVALGIIAQWKTALVAAGQTIASNQGASRPTASKPKPHPRPPADGAD